MRVLLYLILCVAMFLILGFGGIILSQFVLAFIAGQFPEFYNSVLQIVGDRTTLDNILLVAIGILSAIASINTFTEMKDNYNEEQEEKRRAEEYRRAQEAIDREQERLRAERIRAAAQAQARATAPPPGVVSPLPQAIPSPPKPSTQVEQATSSPLWLESMGLVVMENGTTKRKRRINVKHVNSIRPVAAFMVNTNELSGKQLPLQFDLVNPKGETVYRCQVKPTVTKGKNIVTPSKSQFKINSRSLLGTWNLRLWAGPYEWGELHFVLINQEMRSFADHIGPDMEMDSVAMARANEKSSGFSIEQLLGPQN